LHASCFAIHWIRVIRALIKTRNDVGLIDQINRQQILVIIHQHHYILLFNPYQAIKTLNAKGKIQQGAYTALFQRAIDVRATDLTEA